MITLPIKKQWFDMVVSGEKPEEYRDLTPHYIALFFKYLHMPVYIKLRNGYRSDSPSIDVWVIPQIGYGHPKWGAEPGKQYLVLKIIDRGEKV